MDTFLANTWYMAGWAEEMGDGVLGRRIAGRPVVLFRDEHGAAAALADRCPHRYAPLSRGSRRDGQVVCGYHGLAFDRSGACVGNPFSNKLPPAAVRSYPVVERDDIVWLWFGDPVAADSAAIPDFGMTVPAGDTKVIRGLMPMKAGYEFGTDNLMDLSHIEFVHRGSFAGQGVIFAGAHEVKQDNDTLRSNWWMPGVKAPGHTVGIYPRDMTTNHWLDMRWNAPASMHLEIGAAPLGAARETGVIVHQAHILTPETEDTTHYFWASTYAEPAGAPDLRPVLESLLRTAFEEEDKPMIEAAYANLEGADFWSERPVSLGIDQGGTRARRLIQAMKRRETAAAVAA